MFSIRLKPILHIQLKQQRVGKKEARGGLKKTGKSILIDLEP